MVLVTSHIRTCMTGAFHWICFFRGPHSSESRKKSGLRVVCCSNESFRVYVKSLDFDSQGLFQRPEQSNFRVPIDRKLSGQVLVLHDTTQGEGEKLENLVWSIEVRYWRKLKEWKIWYYWQCGQSNSIQSNLRVDATSAFSECWGKENIN